MKTPRDISGAELAKSPEAGAESNLRRHSPNFSRSGSFGLAEASRGQIASM